MPRRNRPRREQPPELRTGPPTSSIPAPAGWQALRHAGGEPNRTYTCPGCESSFNGGSSHVVAWRVEEEDHRRHWHTGCWERAKREGLDRYRWV